MKRTATLSRWALLLSSLLLVGVAIFSGDFLTTKASSNLTPGIPNQLPTCIVVPYKVGFIAGNTRGIGNTNLVVDPVVSSTGLVPVGVSNTLQTSYSLFCPPSTTTSTAIPGAGAFSGISSTSKANLNPALAPTCRLVPGIAGSVGGTGNTNLTVSADITNKRWMSLALKNRLENETSLFCPHLVIVPPPSIPSPDAAATATAAANNAAATAAANNTAATAAANNTAATAAANNTAATAQANDKVATTEAKDDQATAKAEKKEQEKKKKEKEKKEREQAQATKTAQNGTFKTSAKKVNPKFSGCGEQSTQLVEITEDIDGGDKKATIPYTKVEDPSGCTVTYSFAPYTAQTCRFNYFEANESAPWTLSVQLDPSGEKTLISKFPGKWEHDTITGAVNGTAEFPGQGTVLFGPYFVDECVAG